MLIFELQNYHQEDHENGEKIFNYLVYDIVEEMWPEIIWNFLAQMAVEYSKQSKLVAVDLLKLCKNIILHRMRMFALNGMVSMGYLLVYPAPPFSGFNCSWTQITFFLVKLGGVWSEIQNVERIHKRGRVLGYLHLTSDGSFSFWWLIFGHFRRRYIGRIADGG